MAYTYAPCVVGFSTGQGIRIREYIANVNNSNALSVLAKRISTPIVDLYIKDSPEDFGEEPNILSAYTWISQDIWIRHTDDGIKEYQNPEFDTNIPNYAYVEITNRGCDKTDGSDTVKLYWAKASTSLEWDYHWSGNHFPNNGPLLGEEFGTITIPVLNPHETIRLSVTWWVPNPQNYESITTEPWHFCLLARIISINDPMNSPEVDNLYQNVVQNNNIAQRNITIVNLEPNSIQKPIGASIAIGSLSNNEAAYSLEFISDNKETGKKIFEEAEVAIKLDPIIFEGWVRGGKKGSYIEVRHDETIVVNADHAKIENILLVPHQKGTANISFNFLIKEITNKEKFSCNIVQIEDSTGNVVGGETYEIRKYPRGMFYANPGDDKVGDKNDPIILSATVLNEPAIYNWYDSDGNLIFQGKDFSVSLDVATKYKLEVIAISDGFKDYKEVEVNLRENNISSIIPNPATDAVLISYKINKGSSSYLAVNTLYGSNDTSYNYIVDNFSSQINLNLQNYPSGYYSVALITDGVITDSAILIKQ